MEPVQYSPMLLGQGILLLALLAGAGFFSAAETALFGLSRAELNAFRASTNTLHQQTYHLMRHPRQVLLTILIASTIVNVLYFAVASIATAHFAKSGAVAASAAVLITLLAMIVLGELCPKAAALASPSRLAPLTSPVIQSLHVAFLPAMWVLDRLVAEPLVRLVSSGPPPAKELNNEELRRLVESSARDGTLDTVENEMLQEVVGLPEIHVRSIMIPRVDIVAVRTTDSVEEMLNVIREARFTKLPVYQTDLDDIQGLIYARDLYLRTDTSVTALIRPVTFVPEQANLIQLVAHFRRTGSALAIVVDEYGGTAGLVTIEDVLEQVVGNIKGRGEEAPQPAEAIGPDTYRLAGDLNVRRWADEFGIHRDDLRADTVGGLVLARLGRMPRPGDTVQFQNLLFTVESVIDRRIASVLLRRNHDGAPDQGPGGSS